MANECEILALVKGFFREGKPSQQALADVFREHGDEEFAAELSEGPVWFHFDMEEAKGKVGVHRGAWGLYLCVDDRSDPGDPVALFDLFPRANDESKPTCLNLFDDVDGDLAARATLSGKGLDALIVSGRLDRSIRCSHEFGIHDEQDFLFETGEIEEENDES